jgi:hypothetical protein
MIIPNWVAPGETAVYDGFSAFLVNGQPQNGTVSVLTVEVTSVSGLTVSGAGEVHPIGTSLRNFFSWTTVPGQPATVQFWVDPTDGAGGINSIVGPNGERFQVVGTLPVTVNGVVHNATFLDYSNGAGTEYRVYYDTSTGLILQEAEYFPTQETILTFVSLSSPATPVTPAPPNPNAPPAGTTADMILRHGADGQYEIYDIGNNAILAAHQLGQVGTNWQFAGLGGFNGSDTTDMLLRNSGTGGFEVYDISNNNITGATFLGTVGLNWQVMGFGNFSSRGENDMILRNSNTGGVEVYDLANNQITGAAFMGTVGLNWQVAGFGNFSSLGESDTILRNTSTGGLEVYDIANNQITNAAFMGAVGFDWKTSGFGNFSSNPGETDMLLRNSKTGGLEVYDINGNQLTGAAFIGTVGLDWQFAGIGPVHGAGESDLVLRNGNTGAFEVYDIANNQITGAAPLGTVGLDWQLGGFAVDPPTTSTASMGDSSQVGQLVQAMAGFGGGSGAADSLNTPPLGADTSQQTLLTTPQHG